MIIAKTGMENALNYTGLVYFVPKVINAFLGYERRRKT
jgi:hypothetical protein